MICGPSAAFRHVLDVLNVRTRFMFQVNIFNGLNMESMVNFTGTQVSCRTLPQADVRAFHEILCL